MKIISTLVVAMSLLTASSAFAELQCGENGDMSPWCAILLVSTSPYTTVANLVGSTSAPSIDQNREAYVNLVREDAAEFVAADGTSVAGAFLQDAIKSIRQKSTATTQMSDLEIAKLVATTLK